MLLSGFLSAAALLMVAPSDATEIIGGKEVKPHSLPYMALLLKNTPYCGGVLINPQWVLTAAHCYNPKSVWLGVHAMDKSETTSRQRRDVRIQVPHPLFENKSKVNDLMLLKLDKPVKQTKTVKCLELPRKAKDPKAGSRCLVAGWGTTSNKNQKMSNVLMSADITVIDRKKCNSTNYDKRKMVITADMICAGSNGKKVTDSCKGDSGGPLVCKGTLVGITSFGPKYCGLMKDPGVYSFLSTKQLQWIRKTMGGNET